MPKPKPRGRGLRGQAHVKTMQLCKQVQRVLQTELSCQPHEVLQALHVVQVEPAPGAGQLLVQVAPILPEDARPINEVLAALEEVSGKLRTEVANAISRRKAPQLFFQVISTPT